MPHVLFRINLIIFLLNPRQRLVSIIVSFLQSMFGAERFADYFHRFYLLYYSGTIRPVLNFLTIGCISVNSAIFCIMRVKM